MLAGDLLLIKLIFIWKSHTRPATGRAMCALERCGSMIPRRGRRSMMELYAIARMTIPLKKLNEAIEILSSVKQRTGFESGCVGCHVYRDVDSPNALMIEEIWKDEKDLARHLRSDEYQKILLVAEMASAPPEIKFYKILHTAGVETVEEARSTEGKQYVDGEAVTE